MTEFVCKIADVTVGVRALYPATRDYCADYLCEQPPELEITLTPEALAYDRAALREMEKESGLPPHTYSDPFLERLSLHRLLSEAMIDRNIFLVHASALTVNGKAYLFTAKSGTGKSTHARLWRECFGERVKMINDDKPFLKITDDAVMVCGSPWNGKHRLGTNIEIPLDAVCLLERAEQNSIAPVDKQTAWAALFSQIFRSNDRARLEKVLRALDRLTDSARLFRLQCNMKPEAAQVAWRCLIGSPEATDQNFSV